MRKRNKKKNYLMLLLLLLIGLGIGYAFLSQELTINGTGKVTASSWHIYFDNLVLNSNNVALSTGDADAEIDDVTETDITYTVTLKNPGDFYEFTVDVVNDGTIDAMVDTVSNKLGGVEIDAQHPLPNYLNYSITYSDGIAIAPNHLLEAGESETYKVRLEYKTDITSNDLPATDQTLTLTFSVDYVQADDNSIPRPLPSPVHLPAGRTKDNLQIGDEIIISGETNEYFNFVRYDGDDIVLLAKYNLKVGRNFDSINSTFSAPYTSSDTGYGLQDSTMKGWVSSGAYNGLIAFSYTNYWYDGSALKAKYGSSYPAYVYDTDYITAPDFSTTCDNSTNCFKTEGYSIAYYVEQYKNTLMGTGYGVPIKEARLLTYAEATDSSIGCDESNNSCPTTGFITNTSFWLGSADYSNYVWFVSSSSRFNVDTWSYGYYFGVRPVITISKSNL